MLLDYIIVTCCTRFGGARSISAVYHLLKGRKSIQTVQDSHIYKLNNYYGVYKSLKKSDFDSRINVLFAEQVLTPTNKTAAIPGEGCMNWLHATEEYSGLEVCFAGARYYNVTTVFWERLLLLIQTLTNSVHGNLMFIPVTDLPAATDWVRAEYRLVRNKEQAYLHKLHGELKVLLGQLNEREAGMVVDSLTGYKQYGMSSFQLADQYKLSRLDVPLIFTAGIHRILFLLEKETKKYPALSRLLRNLPKDSRITNSAQKTNELLSKGYTLNEIASARGLKLNTIHDHLVEIALYDKHFPVDQYVSLMHHKEIISALSKVETNKLKDIKEIVKQEIGYFEIRLVMAAENISQQVKVK